MKDLWHARDAHWLSSRELYIAYDIQPSAATHLAQSPVCHLSHDGTLFVSRVKGRRAQVQFFNVDSVSGQFSRVPGCQGVAGILRWFRGVPRRQLEIVPEQWRWPARSGRGENGNTLLNIHSPSVYHALVQKAKITDKGFFSPSSTLPAAQQEGSLKLIWCLDDVAPKTSALAWRITQRALPNADRWTGLLDMFELSTCHRIERRSGGRYCGWLCYSSCGNLGLRRCMGAGRDARRKLFCTLFGNGGWSQDRRLKPGNRRASKKKPGSRLGC